MAQHDVMALRIKYGGRHENDFRGKMKVSREKISRDGYASGGQYFGRGAPVFRVADAETDGGRVEFYLRGGDSLAVRRLVSAAYPGAAPKRR